MRLLALVLLAAALVAGAASAATAPKLWAKRLAPVQVAGSGFPHGARVLVTVATGSSAHSRWVRATTTGQITATFTTVRVTAPQLCHGPVLVITAKAKGFAAKAVTRVGGGSSRDCAPKQPVNQ
jgi:hypothetical protein